MTDKDQEQYYEEQKRIKSEIEKKHGKTTEQLYQEREKRIQDAIALKEPDRIPLSLMVEPSDYADIQRSAAYYDPLGYKRANRQVTVDFEPDMCFPGLPTSGAAMEILGVTNRLYPGWNLPPDYQYQFREVEFLKEDEYDIFFSDPTDFMLRYYFPRMYSALVPLSKLPPLGTIMSGLEGITTMFDSPEFEEAARALSRAGKEMKKFRETIGDAYEELAELGFPPFSQFRIGGVGGAPFDTVSSFLRGMHGAMLDMYRQPEKLVRLCDMILDRRIASSIPAGLDKRGNPIRIGLPLWRGDKSFMSEKQFEKFYWPGLKRALQANIDLGYVPIPFFEAEFGDRLERLLELPPGKIVASIEEVDIARAREILKGHTCILVRGPFSLEVSSPDEVVEYYKKLFDTYGKGGGILFNIRLPEEGDSEDIKKMMAEIREYCRY